MKRSEARFSRTMCISSGVTLAWSAAYARLELTEPISKYDLNNI